MDKTARNRQARKILENNFSALKGLSNITPPKVGWVRSIREALGMTREQLGARMYSSRKNSKGISTSAVQALERQEAAGTITLDTLERAAQAMGCKLVYALVPYDSLDAIIQKQAQYVVEKIGVETLQTMKLEAQTYDSSLVDSEAAEKVIERFLWNIDE